MIIKLLIEEMEGLRSEMVGLLQNALQPAHGNVSSVDGVAAAETETQPPRDYSNIDPKRLRRFILLASLSI